MNRSSQRRVRDELRPGVVLALAVVSVVGVVGIFRWSQRLITIGLAAGVMILAINVIVAVIRRWHQRNTALESSYASAEEVIRLRRQSPRSRRRPKG